MGLTLLAGPANAGKVELLLDQYLDVLDQDPVLIVPNRPDVDWAERELLRRSPALLGGSITTFDGVFERIAAGDTNARRLASDVQQLLALRAAVAATPLNGLGESARSSGFTDALRDALAEVEAGLVSPEELEGPLAQLHASYRATLDRLGLWDRHRLRAAAAQRLSGELAAWAGQPVFAYGFEDLTEAEWALLRTLAGRSKVTVSLPYEPGRPAFEWLGETAGELARLAGADLTELGPRYDEVAHPALAHLERGLFAAQDPGEAPPLEGAIRFLEGAGTRGALELVGEEILRLLRDGVAPDQIGVVVPSHDRWRAPLETAFATLGIPYAIDAPARLPQTPFGQALLSLVRFAWAGAGRPELFRYLRSPYSGLRRGSVDFVEGRLRGRAISAAGRVEEELEALREARLPALDALRAADTPIEAVRELAGSMLRNAYGLETPPAAESSRDDLRAHEGCRRILDDLEGWERVAGPLSCEDVIAALERAPVRVPQATEPGRIPVLDLARVRTRRFEHIFLLGLEEGSLPRRSPATPFLGDDERQRIGPRLRRSDQVARDRYLFYTACTRPTERLHLVREAASDEGSPREASPFWEEVAALFPADEVARATTRRPLSALTWGLEGAPTERERLRAVAGLWADEARRDDADALARANGWGRRLERARRAFTRHTRLSHPLVVGELRARTVFNVTELERFADCSSAWFFDRMIDPKTIDQEVDAKLRGSVAHSALFRFFKGLPKELGVERVVPERVEDAVRFMHACLEQALAGVRVEMTGLQRRELEQTLARDLERLVRAEAETELPLQPSRFEVSFGLERSVPELQRGLELGDGIVLSGKIDRIDVDPFSASGIVVDYKSGKSAPSARQIDKELRLQIPLYMLVLRDLVGIEPLGGVYRPLSGDRGPRGLLRAEAKEDALPGFAKADYLDEEAFWAQVDGATETARRFAARIREGDVRHDPKGGECPSWCDLWTMCRVRRA
ncbi:MAG TPA: PD-(D/E)XK nuclease family protein [Gaiellaceae bacterium]|nr:PD-(D/E)XK nuclease family protein [Gaiellaceae bacterium]